MLGEITSIDGALTINEEGKIHSFSSIIKSHEKVNKVGARSTAAISSVLHLNNTIALKVSSDGEIELIFKEDDEVINLKFLYLEKFRCKSNSKVIN